MLTLDPSVLLTNLAVAIGGGSTLFVFVLGAKKIAPWLKDKTLILRVGGMVLAALGVLASKAATGNLEGVDLQTFARVLVEALAVWVTAHTTHKALKKNEA